MARPAIKKSHAQIKREVDEILAKGNVRSAKDTRHVGHAGSCGTSACLENHAREVERWRDSARRALTHADALAAMDPSGTMKHGVILRQLAINTGYPDWLLRPVLDELLRQLRKAGRVEFVGGSGWRVTKEPSRDGQAPHDVFRGLRWS